MNQRVAAVLRQTLAVVATLYGIVAASMTAFHLPIAVCTVLVAAGPAILAIEHFVSDPSTGTTPQSSTPQAPSNGGVAS